MDPRRDFEILHREDSNEISWICVFVFRVISVVVSDGCFYSIIHNSTTIPQSEDTAERADNHSVALPVPPN